MLLMPSDEELCPIKIKIKSNLYFSAHEYERSLQFYFFFLPFLSLLFLSVLFLFLAIQKNVKFRSCVVVEWAVFLPKTTVSPFLAYSEHSPGWARGSTPRLCVSLFVVWDFLPFPCMHLLFSAQQLHVVRKRQALYKADKMIITLNQWTMGHWPSVELALEATLFSSEQTVEKGYWGTGEWVTWIPPIYKFFLQEFNQTQKTRL